MQKVSLDHKAWISHNSKLMEEGLPLLPRLLGQLGGKPRPLPLLHLQQHAGSLQPDSLHQSRLHAYQKKVSTIDDSYPAWGFHDTENTIENNVDKIKTLERTIRLLEKFGV